MRLSTTPPRFAPPCSTPITTARPRTRSMQSKALVAGRVLIFYVALVALWQVVYDLHIWSPVLLPEPHKVFDSVKRYVDNGVLFKSIRTTMQNMLVGFVIAFIIGMVIGVAIASWNWLD